MILFWCRIHKFSFIKNRITKLFLVKLNQKTSEILKIPLCFVAKNVNLKNFCAE
jgi:hypothetical protein